MSRPNIAIRNVVASEGVVDFEAEVAGHVVHLRMPAEFVEDKIGDAGAHTVHRYFETHSTNIEDAAWVAAYEDSTKDQKPEDQPGPVPYRGSVTVPFNLIVLRR